MNVKREILRRCDLSYLAGINHDVSHGNATDSFLIILTTDYVERESVDNLLLASLI